MRQQAVTSRSLLFYISSIIEIIIESSARRDVNSIGQQTNATCGTVTARLATRSTRWRKKSTRDGKPLKSGYLPRKPSARQIKKTSRGRSHLAVLFRGRPVEAIRTRGGTIDPSCRFLKPNYFAQFATSEAQRLTASSNASAWLIKRLAITPSNGSCLKAAPSSIARISSAIVSRIQVQFFIFFVSLR